MWRALRTYFLSHVGMCLFESPANEPCKNWNTVEIVYHLWKVRVGLFEQLVSLCVSRSVVLLFRWKRKNWLIGTTPASLCVGRALVYKLTRSGSTTSTSFRSAVSVIELAYWRCPTMIIIAWRSRPDHRQPLPYWGECVCLIRRKFENFLCMLKKTEVWKL